MTIPTQNLMKELYVFADGAKHQEDDRIAYFTYLKKSIEQLRHYFLREASECYPSEIED